MESGWNRIQAVEVKTVKIVSGYTTIDQSGNEDILCELSWASSLQIKVFTESREKRKIYFEGCNRLAFQLKLIISSEQ
jgi:exonuclease III